MLFSFILFVICKYWHWKFTSLTKTKFWRERVFERLTWICCKIVLWCFCFSYPHEIFAIRNLNARMCSFSNFFLLIHKKVSLASECVKRIQYLLLPKMLSLPSDLTQYIVVAAHCLFNFHDNNFPYLFIFIWNDDVAVERRKSFCGSFGLPFFTNAMRW